ncbi:MAG: DNA polymerase I [Deltaproteobacteria bacterium]|nr:DNA polymerase I [Deltaproteobacteria bacterium]
MALMRADVALDGVRFDVGLASYLLASERRGHELEQVAAAELDVSLLSRESLSNPRRGVHLPLDELAPEQVSAYAGSHAGAVFALHDTLAPRLAEGPLAELYRDMELPLARVLVEMELLGVRIDLPRFERMSEEVRGELSELVERAHELAGGSFNVGSPRQLETILFDQMQLPVLKKTKTSRSTSHDVLTDLLLHPEVPEPARQLIEVVLEHRSLAKLEGTYLSALPKLVDAGTGRLRTRYNQAVAATGRLSSSDPNLQNIPIRSELGRRVRAAFVPEPGWKMLAADYSQVELRVLAHLSHDAALVDAYTRGADVHAQTATALFGVDEADVSREQRGAAKTVNFAVIYGQSEFALSRNLRIPRREARRYIQTFFERYEGVARFMDEVVEQARTRGYAETLFGRRRVIPDLRTKNRNLRAAAERVARNTPIQGTAADILKRAMVTVANELKGQGLSARMLLTVHDELVFEFPPEEQQALEALVEAAMAGAAELSVPLAVNLGVGESWGEAH